MESYWQSQARFAFLSGALALMFLADEEDVMLLEHMRRRHRYWVSPYLRPRTDRRQRNTLAKLEVDFLRVSACLHNLLRLQINLFTSPHMI